MKKLSKDQQSRFDALCIDIADRNKELNLLVNSVNLRICEINAELSAMRDKVEETVDSFKELADEVASDIEAYIDERSDAWRESDKGEMYDEWKCAWEEVFEMIKLDELPEVEAAEIDFEDGNYPTEIS